MKKKRTPVYAYFIVVGFGVIAMFLSIAFVPDGPLAMEILTQLGIVIIFGIIAGLLWPLFSWKWGLLITSPILLFFAVTIMIAAPLSFKDVVVIFSSVAFACIGGRLGSLFR